LQVLQDKQRVKVERWVECGCDDDGGMVKVDCDTFYAIERIKDSDDDDDDDDEENEDDKDADDVDDEDVGYDFEET
jgi:hypothetical protein